MSSYELLPCPFCGGESKLYDDYSSERDEHRWQVWHVCDNGPEGESAGYGKAYHTSIDTPWFKSREKAIEAWNTRTPEQAIAATLDGGKLTAEQVREAHDKHWHDLPAEYDMPEASALPEYSHDWQAIADELNAALGGGECMPHGEWERISQTQEVRHVFCECGHELGMDRRDSLLFERTQLFAMPNYCQECGRKIRKAVKR